MLKKVTDRDGEEDEVWFFTKGRAYELAQAYFDCTNAEAWGGLPLMGHPDLGRASHWETRIMRDDVMSYGGAATVSSVTLAAMEDLGFYLGNYSAAQCMSWGRNQGCGYVLSRCGTTIDDRLAAPADQSECWGDPSWATKPVELLTTKCQGGSTPCATVTGSGYLVESGARVCNSQCYTGARTDCAAAPSTCPTPVSSSSSSWPRSSWPAGCFGPASAAVDAAAAAAAGAAAR